jgi:hypothetical protein
LAYCIQPSAAFAEHIASQLFAAPHISVDMPLTATMGVKLGPVMLGTLIKHYLERGTQTKHSKARDEFLFDEVWINRLNNLLSVSCNMRLGLHSCQGK